MKVLEILYLGHSPLFYAVLKGHTNLVEILLKDLSIPAIPPTPFNSPIHPLLIVESEETGYNELLFLACEMGHVEIVKILVMIEI